MGCKDELFNQAIHSCSKAGSNVWYKEKLLKNIKLGGMIVIILLRSVLQNKNDTIFQKTCMNILVQMSVHLSLLDLYPSERLVGCLEFLLKKHSRLVLASEYLDASNVEDLVKNLLVIINNVLVNQTQNNPNLVYSLLYKRKLISSYTNQNEEFIHHFLNVENLLDFTSAKIEEHSDDPNGIMDTSVLLGVIQGALSEYPTETFIVSKNKEVSLIKNEESLETKPDLGNEQKVVCEDLAPEVAKEKINQPLPDKVVNADADLSKNVMVEDEVCNEDVAPEEETKEEETKEEEIKEEETKEEEIKEEETKEEETKEEETKEEEESNVIVSDIVIEGNISSEVIEESISSPLEESLNDDDPGTNVTNSEVISTENAICENANGDTRCNDKVQD